MTSLTKIYDYERFGLPARRGNRWYYLYNSGLNPQDVYYAIEGHTIDGGDRGTVFFDPNTLSDDGTVAVRHTHCFTLFLHVVGY